MTNRQKLSIVLWILALAIWIVAGVLGDLPWWLVTIVVIGFSLQVANAVRIALRSRQASED